MVHGNQLTLTPRAATSAVIVRGVARSMRAPLEKTTYTWAKHYVVETDEWQLELTPAKPTTRDGIAPPEGGYRYSNQTKPAWKYVGEPGV